MTVFTLDDLHRALRESAGVEETDWSTRDVLDVTFQELGCDSLAMLDLISRVQNDVGVPISEQDLDALTTPRGLLEYVSARQDPTSLSAATDNAVLIEAPMQAVWDQTNDVSSWPLLFTEYASTEILHQDGDTVRFRLTMKPDEDGKVWSWVSERTMDRAARTVQAHRVETGPFEFMRINWDYVQVEAGVQMRWRQEFHLRPSAPIDDAAMAERLNRNTLTQMAVIKERVEAQAGRAA
jgi:aromatase